MSAQVARSRNSPATPERLSLRRHLWGTLLPRSHQGRKGQVKDSEEKRRKPGDALECLLQHPLSFTSTIPEQMSLGRRREHLPCSWRVGEAEQERLYDAVKSNNKEIFWLNYSSWLCVSIKKPEETYIIPVVKQELMLKVLGTSSRLLSERQYNNTINKISSLINNISKTGAILRYYIWCNVFTVNTLLIHTRYKALGKSE